MGDLERRAAKRLGLALLPVVLLAGGCIGLGQIDTGPSGSTAVPSVAISPSRNASPSPPSLPEVLAAKTWVTLNPVGSLGAAVAGTLDGHYHLTLPADEVALAAADLRVVSAIWTKAPDGSTQDSTLVVRDLRRDGAEIARFETAGPVVAGQAVLSGDTLFFAGNSAPDRIAGVYAGSLADSTVRTLIDPGPVPDNLAASTGSVVFAIQTAPGVSRSPVVLSPSGRTLGSAVCGNGRCNIELVDVPSGKARQAFTGVPFGLWLLGEAVLIGVDDTSVYGYDASGRSLWALKDKRPQSPGYLTSDGSQLIVLYQDVDPNADAVVVLGVVDVSSGAERVLRRWERNEPAPLLWAAVSSDETAVLIPNGLTPEAALDAGGGSFEADLLDLQTGTLAPGALVVSAR